jgi:hypothetical protein
MSADDPSELAAHQLADGQSVDWDELAGLADNDDERERLECMRILSAIADVHRSVDAPDGSAGPRSSARLPPFHATQGDAAGEAWGRYTLLEEVGSGSFGSVYRAWDPELEREIAIKILHRRIADAQLREGLLREGRALAKVRDPNVVSVLGVESYGDRVGLCMEFVHGETLDQVARSHGTLNAREAILVGQDVCRALAAVHRAGFVHRDVKAKNIMRERAGRIVLMDFGTGREVESLQATGNRWAVAGTPLYMAPEVLAGQPASACSDVYSVGVLLYHLVTGKYPVEGKTLEEIRAAHMFGKRTAISERRSDLPTAFISVVDRALAPNPPQRCPSAGELLEALALAGGQALSEERTRVRALFRVAAVVVSIIVGLTGLGVVNTAYFNSALGRSRFTDEGLADALLWGFRSIVAPTALLVMSMIGLALLIACLRLLLGLSATARRIEKNLLARITSWNLADPGNVSCLVLVASAAVLACGWVYFLPLIGALLIVPDISTVPGAQLAQLSPAFQRHHETYRMAFTWITIVCIVAWYPAFRLAARSGERLNRGILAGGAAIVMLSLLLLDFPYRMLSQNNLFEVAQWRGERCYILGERDDDLLVFCPALDPPRNRIVSRGATDLQRLGVTESIFAQFSSNP